MPDIPKIFILKFLKTKNLSLNFNVIKFSLMMRKKCLSNTFKNRKTVPQLIHPSNVRISPYFNIQNKAYLASKSPDRLTP